MFQCEGNGVCEASWPRDPTWALRNKGPTGGKHASHARRPSRRIPMNDLGFAGKQTLPEDDMAGLVCGRSAVREA